MIRKITILLLLLTTIVLGGKKRETNDKPLKVFFDAHGSLFQYLQSDVNFIDLVRDPQLAEVHILLNSLPSGGGGREYTITFIGLNGFSGINDTLSYTFPQSTPLEERNDQIIRLIKVGLARYIAETDYSKYLDISFSKKYETEVIKDDWDGWVFGIGINGSVEGEESQKEFNWQIDTDIDRVKEDSKLMINARMSNDLEIYNSDDGQSRTSTRRRIFNTLYVLSVSDHFSAGFFTGIKSNTYNNIKLSYDIAPAVEYNIFPYTQSVRRTFSFLYRIGYVKNNYFNKTIYNKTEDDLFRQSLSIGYRMNEMWGEVHFYLTAANYMHDFKKNKIDLWSRFSYRLTGSLSFDVQAEASYIKDQLYLEQEGGTLEEILLNQKSLATSYEYRFRLGFRYTFGSIYNNIVNTRF